MASAHVLTAAPDPLNEGAAATASAAESVESSHGADELPPTLAISLTRTETTLRVDEQATVSSTGCVLNTSALSSTQIHDTFLSAEHFVAVVLSRLRKDAIAIDPRLWSLQVHERRLWALKQQALLGSCDTSRGSKEYLQALDADDSIAGNNSISSSSFLWRPCCFRMKGESKIKLWQDLGDMPHEQAKVWYINIVTDICPEWRHPLRTDSALLRTWTPDDESDECAICAEAFTFLNRRHHCRRCLSLVCAVCSPHTAPLRVFTATAPQTRQRICSTCFLEMSGIEEAERLDTQSSKQSYVRASDYATASVGDDSSDTVRSSASDSVLLQSSETSYTRKSRESSSAESDGSAVTLASSSASTVSTLASTSTLVAAATPPLLASTSTIHCGTLEFFHGSGFRKSWHAYFFVLLLRKGSLGMFLHAQDHVEHKKRPAAVFKLSGYIVRVKSQKRRPHQLVATHATKKTLQFAARSIDDMNSWIAQLLKAIGVANELEALASIQLPRRRGSVASSFSGGSSGTTSPVRDNDFVDRDNDSGNDDDVDTVDETGAIASGDGHGSADNIGRVTTAEA